jgi:DNA repair protein RecO (recombination protein O)
MYFKTKAIVLNQIKYSDTSLIVALYTEAHGRQSFLIQGVYKKKSKYPPVYFQPLTLLEIESAISPKRELQRIKDAYIIHPFHSIPFDPVKSSIALFISEILYKTLREEENNPVMFQYLENAIEFMDRMDAGIANYHIWFMLNLTRHLGFYPVCNYSAENYVFDLVNGRFYNPLLTNAAVIERELAKWINNFLTTSPEKLLELELNHQMRNQIISMLVEYYHIHMGHLGNIKSLAVLQGVFA